MTDTRSCGDAATAPTPETSHNPFSGLLSHVQHAASCVESTVKHGAVVAHDKYEQVSHDPKVRANVAQAGQVGERIGIGALNGVKNDGLQTVAAAQRGDVVGVVKHVAPLAIGGGIPAIVVREVAPQVINSGMRELPTGTRQQIQSSTVGRTVLGNAEHGNLHVPTSPMDIARLAIPNVKAEVVQAALRSTAPGRAGTPAASVGDHPAPAAAPNFSNFTQRMTTWIHSTSTPADKPKQ